MLLQIDLFVVRAIQSLSIQLFGGIVGIYLGARLLRRRKNEITIPISMFYILLGSTYVLLAMFIFVFIDPLTLIVYIVADNLFFSCFTLTVIFSTNLLRPKEEAFSKWQIIYVVGYATVNVLLSLIPGYIRLDESTDWIPIISLELSIVLMVNYSIAVFVPEMYLIFKVLNQIREKKLKSKLKMFLLGNLWLLITVYGLIFYVVMPENLMYRNVYSVFSIFNAVPLALIYFGTKEI